MNWLLRPGAALTLGLGAFLLSSQPAFAVRLVSFRVSIAGKVVLQAQTGDSGHQDPDAVWQYLKKLELRPVKGYEVEADGDDPLRATLQGKVVIEGDYGGRAEVSELKLVRDQEDARWKLAPAEVERTLKSRHKPFRFSVSIDGKVLLWTNLETLPGDTREDADTVWRSLKRLEVYPANRYKVEADGDDPLQATLQGKVVIQEYYGGHYGSRAEVSNLKLVRKRTNAWKWQFAPGELERILIARNKPK